MSEVGPSAGSIESPRPPNTTSTGSTSSSSHASSTPKTDNTGAKSIIQDLNDPSPFLPESTQQPVLLPDTTDPSLKKSLFQKRISKNNRVAPMLQDEQKQELKVETSFSSPPQQSSVPPEATVESESPSRRPQGSQHRHHRRIRSHSPDVEQLQGLVDPSYDPYVVMSGQQQQQHRRVGSMEQSPDGKQRTAYDPHMTRMMKAQPYPQPGMPPPPSASGTMTRPPADAYAPHPPRRAGSRVHHRVRSLPNDPRFVSPFFTPPGMTSPGANYGGGGGYHPEQQQQYGGRGGYAEQQMYGGGMNTEQQQYGGGTYPEQSYGGGGRYPEPQQQYAPSRRRSSSYSGGVPGGSGGPYGSFEEVGQPPKVPIPSGGFSPRDELRHLTSGFSPSSPRSGYPPSTGSRSPRVSSPRMSPSNLRSGYGRSQSELAVSFSPRVDRNGVMASPRGYMQQPPLFALDDSLRSSGDFAGERAFQSNRRHNRSSGRSAASSGRKRHMRQNSAQLFMAEIKGEVQPPRCRNVFFALLFVFHWIGIMYLGSTYSRDAIMTYRTANQETVNVWYRNVIFLASLCGFFAVGVSTLAVSIMSIIARRMVQVALFMTIAMSFAWGTIGIGLSPRNFVPITGVIALMLSVGYTFVVWDRIPFASANLHAALNGIRENTGTVLVAFGFQFLALIWSIYYTFVVIGVYDAVENEDLVLSDGMTKAVYVGLAISYYWTFQVLLNVVQVTVASTIGSWWFKPDRSSSFCDETVRTAFLHAIFFEFGTICFGSLFVGPVRLVRQLSAFFRPSQEEGVLLCLHECLSCVQNCIAGCVDALSDRFNPWALTYVGLYGYGLLEAGHSATALFQKRGWTTIVTDDLVPNVLLMASLVIGGLTGVFGTVIESLDALDFSTLDRPFVSSFMIGCYMGVVITSVLFGIISSSVNAVIVCFAGSPFEFEKNHPELSAEMRAAWRDVWPGCMDVIDHRIQSGFTATHGRLPEEMTPLVFHSSPSM